MKFIGDFHIHSKYSRAVSPEMTLENLDKWAGVKGIKVMATGDFTHPKWFKEIREKLEPAEAGLFKLKEQYKIKDFPIRYKNDGIRFLLTAEISSIYSKAGKVRRIHNLVFLPSIEAVEKFNAHLGLRGNLASDGRPIVGVDSKDILKLAYAASPEALIIPAHCLLPDSVIHTKDNLITEIKDIKEGDHVFTHKNRWQKVMEVLTRSYKGKVYKIRPYYFREGLTTTAKHPYFAIKTKRNCYWNKGICKPSHLNYERCTAKYFKDYKPQWITADKLKIGDVLIYPRFKNAFSNHSMLNIPQILGNIKKQTVENKIRFKGTRSEYIKSLIPIDKNFCRLTGYYLAEGYTNGRDAIGFTFNKNEEEYIKDVINLVRIVFGLNKYKLREFPSRGIELIFYSKVLYKVFSQTFYLNSENCNASTKVLPYWCLGLGEDLQIEIFKGWWRGDKGYTVSRILMNQMKIILLRLGIIPSIYKDTPEAYEKRGNHSYRGRRIRSNSTLYSLIRLSFFEDKFNLLSESEFKQFNCKTKIRHGWIDENYIYLPIRDIEIKEYNGKVYNLEVENDNSYVSEFTTIHNCWTPWFSIFGSKSGFDSIEECFDEYSKYIYAIETGLSSDPAMNWRLSKLDNITLISNSDSHSLTRIGREANVFDAELSYKGIADAIKFRKLASAENGGNKLLYTVEFFPEEGKYHYDGHRVCNVCFNPEESKKNNFICPVCSKPLTLGVLYRVDELADRQNGLKPPSAADFKNMVPLDQIIGDALDIGANSKSVWNEYKKLIEKFGNEFSILFESNEDELKNSTAPAIAEGIVRVRNNKLEIKPGYDGEYGVVKIFTAGERENFTKQITLL